VSDQKLGDNIICSVARNNKIAADGRTFAEFATLNGDYVANHPEAYPIKPVIPSLV